MGTHARFSPSASSRWLHCPGSISLSDEAPKGKGSFYAREGTAAHALGEHCLLSNTNAHDHIGQTFEGFVVDEEMADAVAVYVETVLTYLAEMGPDATILVEERVVADFIHETDCFGTGDCVIYNSEKAVVIDYKHGKGHVVQAEGNTQLVIYGSAALYEYAPFVDTLELVIVQPRARSKGGPVKTWECTADEIEPTIVKLREAAEEADSNNPSYAAGDWCHYCPAQAICPTIAKKAFEVAQVEFGEFVEPCALPTVNTLSVDDLRYILDHAGMVKTFLSAVETYCYDQLDRGKEIPGYKLVNKRKYSKWLDENKAEKLLVKAIGKAGAYTSKILSPAQAKKALKKLDDDLRIPVEELIETKSSGTTMVPDSDPRAAISNSAESDFGEFSQS